MMRNDFLPVMFIILLEWMILPHPTSGKHVVIKIHVPKLVNHQHHTNLVLLHKYKKPTHHHVVPHHHSDHHHHHHHHHHGHKHHHGQHHKDPHHVHHVHHTTHDKPNHHHHHSHSYGHHHHVSYGHGHPHVHPHVHHTKTTHTKDSKPHNTNAKDPKKKSRYTTGSFFNLPSAFQEEKSDKVQSSKTADQFETITEVPTDSHDFQVENIKASPELHSSTFGSYEVHEDHPQEYTNDYDYKNFDYPFKDSKLNEELKDYSEDYTNPFSVSKFTKNIEHGSINLEETHYNPDHESEISEYVNEYNEADYN